MKRVLLTRMSGIAKSTPIGELTRLNASGETIRTGRPPLRSCPREGSSPPNQISPRPSDQLAANSPVIDPFALFLASPGVRVALGEQLVECVACPSPRLDCEPAALRRPPAAREASCLPSGESTGSPINRTHTCPSSTRLGRLTLVAKGGDTTAWLQAAKNRDGRIRTGDLLIVSQVTSFRSARPQYARL